ncbi:acyl carrier protein [Selenomonas bovis]|uniref:acyl carrier protein n=1 Tax=Selenomonas bovis TaxID=416586 RepID=UPI000373FE9C|nr:acyl carrier protein [Selenomonas bovis]MCI7057087.1 acyl carrier protein [Selenomonas bovis]
MEQKIREILADLRPEFDFTEDVDFIEEGYLDSFDIVQLVAMLEKEYEVKIKGIDIVPENFSSVAAMAELLKKSGAK